MESYWQRGLWLFIAAALVAPPAAAQSFVNFESPQTRPIALAPGGGLLYAVNTPDSRLSVIDTSTLALVADIPVGLEPVAVAPRPGASEVWVVNHLSDTVDVIQVGTWQLLKTIPVGDEPASIVFTPGGSKAYVTLSRADQVAVIDSASRAVTRTLSLATPPSLEHPGPPRHGAGPDGLVSLRAPLRIGQPDPRLTHDSARSIQQGNDCLRLGPE